MNVEELFGSAAAFEQAERDLTRMLRERGIFFGEGLIPTYVWAYFAPAERIERWTRASELLVRAGEHVAKRLVEDAAFYAAMGLAAEAHDLVQIDPGYARSLVLARPDGIPVGGEVKFVELNCDSPAMMSFLDHVGACLLELAPFAAFARPPSCVDPLLDTLLACYREFGGIDTPTIAITDWEGQKTRYEHLRLAEHFAEKGVPTIVCDPRAFRRVDGKLEVGGRRIQLVYRRALASELVERRAEVEPLLACYRDHTICMVNPLRSYIAGAKAVLSRLARATDLPAELAAAAQLVPRTLVLDSDDARATVTEGSSRWALKKSESHGGLGVALPDGDPAAWHAALESSKRETWIAQEYLEVPRMSISATVDGAIVRSEKYYNWNPFLFGGRYAGGLVRVSEKPLINITLGGGLMPTLTV